MVRIRITSRELELLKKSFENAALLFDLKIVDSNVLIEEDKIEVLRKIINCICDYFLSVGLQENDEPNLLGLELEDLNTKFIRELQRENDKFKSKTKIDGIITDKEVDEKYISFDSLTPIGFLYSSDIRNGTDVRVFLKTLPSFNEVFECFLSCKSFLFRNKKQDICLSLFYQPYFDEFCERLKSDINIIPKRKKRFIKKYMLEYLASPIHYHIIVERELFNGDRKYYIEKNIYPRSKELLLLLNRS